MSALVRTQPALPIAVEPSPTAGLKPRKPPRPGMQAWQQGDLDSLCGVYAVINALRLLYPALDHDAASVLFRKLVRSFGQILQEPLEPIHGGMHRCVLDDLLAVALRQMQRHHGVTIRIEPLVLWRRRPDLGDVWEALNSKFTEGQVTILELLGAVDHWTVAYAGSEATLRLFDSAGRHCLNRTRCTLQSSKQRYRIRPKNVLVLSREA